MNNSFVDLKLAVALEYLRGLAAELALGNDIVGLAPLCMYWLRSHNE